MKKIANNVHHEALIMANFVLIIPGIAFKLEKLTQLFSSFNACTFLTTGNSFFNTGNKFDHYFWNSIDVKNVLAL